MLHTQIKDEIKQAMLAKDQIRLTVLRGLLSAFTNDLVSKKRMPQEILSDEEALEVIKRAVKQRKDSIEQFTSGGRPELAEDEKAELSVLEKYLPEMMTQDEIKPIAEAKITEMGMDKSKAGMIVGAIMKDLKGKADGNDVKAVVDSLLS